MFPAEIDGKPLGDCLARIQNALLRYSSSSFRGTDFASTHLGSPNWQGSTHAVARLVEGAENELTAAGKAGTVERLARSTSGMNYLFGDPINIFRRAAARLERWNGCAQT